jgi:hypothetical protein
VTTVSTVTNLAQQGGVAISLNTGVRDTGTQRVTIATNDVVPVTDNSGSLTVDYATTGSGTATGALRVELPTNGTGVIATVGAVTAITNALPAGSNVIGALTANQSVNTAQVNAVTVLTGTGATGTGSQRVTVAVDSATVAGSASLPAGTNAIGKLAANSGVIIGDVNVVSLIPGVAATSLGKAEDAAHTTGDTGVMMFAVRNNNGATTFTDTNLDYSPISVSANGSLYLGSVIPGTTATELGKAEDQASAGGDVGVLAMAMRRDTPVANDNTNADGDYTQIKLDNLGKLWTAQTQTEDAAHTSGDRGSFILGVRNTANTTLAGTDGDYAPIAVDIMSGPVSGVRRQSTILTAINTTYDDSPTTATSASVDCSMFRRGSFNAIVTESGTATDITFTLQFSNDGGTTWFDYRVGPWVKYRFDDATIAAHASNQLKICEPFECVAPNVRMIVTGVGTDASNSFTVANATFELVN